MRYSQDLRKKAVEYLLKGNSRRKTVKIFQVHYETIGIWVKKIQNWCENSEDCGYDKYIEVHEFQQKNLLIAL